MDNSDSELNKAIKFFPSSTNESVKREDYPQLENNNADRLATGIKWASNLVPYGSILFEVITNLIPNLKIDRIKEYVESVNKALDELRVEVRQEKLRQIENIAIFEDGAYQAARALSPERIKWIAHCVANGIASDDINKIRQKRVLNLLKEVDDEQILILYKSYKNPMSTSGYDTEDNDFNFKDSKNVTDKTLYISGIRFLENLGLIDSKIIPNLKIIISEEHLNITHLGKLLIETIGLDKKETDET